MDDLLFAIVLASVALTGIEAASGFAGEVRVGRRGLRRVVLAGAITVITLFLGMSVVALMALPVEGTTTPLGDRWEEAPVLGVVSEFEPTRLMDAFRYAVGAIGAFVLLEAANSNMLGISRLSYSLATNRQIPSLMGRLYRRRGTPYVAISMAALFAFALVLPSDLDFMAGIFAFGAMLALTIAHVAVIVLRFREPDARRAYFIPGNVRVRGTPVPVPAVLGALAAGAGLVFVILFSEAARWTGMGWMLFGLVLYVVYRRSSGKPLAKRFTIPATALEEAAPVEYGSILVPVFGEDIDDDIIGTAGRLAAEEQEEGEGGPMIEALYVMEMPLALPLDARVDESRVKKAYDALQRAKEVGEEYEGVEVATATVRGRSVGAAIVDEARRRGVEAIVLAAHAPTKVRGGARWGGRKKVSELSLDSMTEYVVEKAPCRVILTAAPAGEEGEREGVAP
ncbi:MAG: amino acid permease [Thermoleophilaceae bacterium]|nr:amino acid permease [Thermoleophilaceae bacterium]